MLSECAILEARGLIHVVLWTCHDKICMLYVFGSLGSIGRSGAT
jgi:hypothetical protein